MFKLLWFVASESWVVVKLVLKILEQLRADPTIKPILDETAKALATLDTKDKTWLANDPDPQGPRATVLALLQSLTWWSKAP